MMSRSLKPIEFLINAPYHLIKYFNIEFYDILNDFCPIENNLILVSYKMDNGLSKWVLLNPCTIWIIGLSGAGKTTISTELRTVLNNM